MVIGPKVEVAGGGVATKKPLGRNLIHSLGYGRLAAFTSVDFHLVIKEYDTSVTDGRTDIWTEIRRVFRIGPQHDSKLL